LHSTKPALTPAIIGKLADKLNRSLIDDPFE